MTAPATITTVRSLPKIQRKRAAYRSVFTGVAGEIVMKDLYGFCNGMRTGFVRGDQYETAFNEGKRAVFIRIFEAMKYQDERKELKRLEEIRDE